MNTTTQTHCRISQAIRRGIAAIANRVVQASLIVARYAYWFLSVVIFFSCQKNLTQTEDSANVITQKTETPAEKFVAIGSSEYAVANRILSLSLTDSSVYRKVQDKMAHFYLANAFKTKWMEADGPAPLYYALFDHFKNAAHYALDPETYRIDQIEQRINTLYKNKSATSAEIIDADMLISETFFLFAIHLREGRIAKPGYGDKIWIRHHHPADHSDATLLASAKTPLELDALLKRLQPADDQYVKLQRTLILYRTLEKSDAGQLPVSVWAIFKPGNRYSTIPAIRKKLSLMEIPIDTSDESSKDSLLYDQGLVSAVKTFQQRHGLEADGLIKGKTLTYLIQSFEEKADLIALNMERIRWQSAQHAAQCIRVNIPEYKLRIYEQGKQALEMNVIVGAVSNATPVFSDTLEYVVLSPTWTVPARIIREEFLPRLKKDSMYYAQRKNFVFFKNGVKIDPSTVAWDNTSNVREYLIIQQPGPDNALGLAKFIMPNDMNIYLHDTPDHKPFSKPYRALSHGCIRLDNPARFAAHLLYEDAEWDLKKIKKAMTSGKPTKILLRKQYEVHLEYQTVWVDDLGNLNFREDIYGHDKRQLQRLCQVAGTGDVMALR